MTNSFTPTEQAILSNYFRIARPEVCAEIDIAQPPEGDGIFVEPVNDYEVVEDTPLKNAVARIALSVIQNRLPQCGVFDGDKLPQHLFTINWADSAPGISWPEAYHATYIPGFDRYVVTASVDGTDMYGVTELAIGFFEGDRQPAEGCADVLKNWWRYLQENCQDRWAYVWDEGLIDRAAANGWADEVWVKGHTI